MIKDYIDQIQSWTYTYIGPLSESALKHRNHILLISVLMVLISPEVKVTFGKVNALGLGISLDPPQTIHIGILLFSLLLYRTIAFWVTALISNGKNEKNARRKAALKVDPSELIPPAPRDMVDVIHEKSESIIYNWKFIGFIWEFIVPNLLAMYALTSYTYHYFHHL